MLRTGRGSTHRLSGCPGACDAPGLSVSITPRRAGDIDPSPRACPPPEGRRLARPNLQSCHVGERLGHEGLRRTASIKATRKAAWCAVQGLPRPEARSLTVNANLIDDEFDDIIIVDDVVTRGAAPIHWHSATGFAPAGPAPLRTATCASAGTPDGTPIPDRMQRSHSGAPAECRVENPEPRDAASPSQPSRASAGS